MCISCKYQDISDHFVTDLHNVHHEKYATDNSLVKINKNDRPKTYDNEIAYNVISDDDPDILNQYNLPHIKKYFDEFDKFDRFNPANSNNNNSRFVTNTGTIIKTTLLVVLIIVICGLCNSSA